MWGVCFVCLFGLFVFPFFGTAWLTSDFSAISSGSGAASHILPLEQSLISHVQMLSRASVLLKWAKMEEFFRWIGESSNFMWRLAGCFVFFLLSLRCIASPVFKFNLNYTRWLLQSWLLSEVKLGCFRSKDGVRLRWTENAHFGLQILEKMN